MSSPASLPVPGPGTGPRGRDHRRAAAVHTGAATARIAAEPHTDS